MSHQPRTRRERREQERRGPGTGIAVAVIAALALGAAIWFGKDLFTGSPTAAPSTARASSTAPTTAPTTSPTQATSPSPTSSATTDPVVAQVAACRTAWQRQKSALAAAATSVGEWQAHLKIMNDLQAGKISLAKAKKDWGPTTAQASPHIAAFHEADKAYTSGAERCDNPDTAATNADAAALKTCAQGMKVNDGVLAAARTAIEPWETHLKDQSHFKAGGITAIKAEALWRSLWQKGLKLNPPYFAAVKSGASAACPLAG